MIQEFTERFPSLIQNFDLGVKPLPKALRDTPLLLFPPQTHPQRSSILGTASFRSWRPAATREQQQHTTVCHTGPLCHTHALLKKKLHNAKKKKSSLLYKRPASIFRSDLACKRKSAGKKVDANTSVAVTSSKLNNLNQPVIPKLTVDCIYQRQSYESLD